MKLAPLSRRTGWLVTTVVLAVLLWVVTHDRTWFVSTDFALHFAAVHRITHDGLFFPSEDEALQVMARYPRGTYAISALMGWLLGSPLLGVHVSGFVWLLLLWAALASLWKEQPDRELALSIPLLVASLWMARRLRLDFHGYELVGNYFLAHFAAQSIEIVSLYLWSRLQARTVAPLARYGFPCAIAVVLVSFHLLPALEMLGFAAILVLLDRSRPGCFYVGAAALGFLVHPAARTMKEFSQHDGSLPLTYAPNLPVLAAVCLLALVLAAPGLLRWPSGRVDLLRLVSAHAAVIAGLCLAQMAALGLGLGSFYACKKWGFGLMTSILLLGVLWTARLLARKLPAPPLETAGAFLRSVVVAIVMPAAVLAVRPASGFYDIARLAEIDRVLCRFHETHPRRAGQPADYAQGIEGAGLPGDLFGTIACLRHPWNKTFANLVEGRLSPDPARDRFLLTSPSGVPAHYRAAITERLEAGLVAIDVARLVASAFKLNLSDHAPPDGVVLEGFGLPEGFGRWTVGKSARIRCRVPKELAMKTRGVQLILATGFAPRGHPEQARISVNGGRFQSVLYDGGPKTILLGYRRGNRPEELEIRFELPEARSPLSVGTGQDARELAMAVDAIELVTAP